MKTLKVKHLTLLIALMLSAFCYGQDEKPIEDMSLNAPMEKPDIEQMEKQATPEMVEKIIITIEEKDPEKAQHLRQLREENPEAFRSEMRKEIRKFGPDKPRPEGERPARNMKKQRGNDNAHKDFRERFQKEKELFAEWFQDNYPQKALELETLEKQNPELFREQAMEVLREYGPLYRAEKNNPELAETLKKDRLLKEQSAELVKKIAAAKTDEEKQALTSQLKEITSSRFDIIIMRKQLQITEMQKKLAELQAKTNQKETELKELQKNKEAEVQSRMTELLEKDKGMSWD